MYVAKSPPWPYVLAAGPAALSRALGLPGGALFGLRVTNLLGAAVAVAATYALGRELSGGDRGSGWWPPAPSRSCRTSASTSRSA